MTTHGPIDPDDDDLLGPPPSHYTQSASTYTTVEPADDDREPWDWRDHRGILAVIALVIVLVAVFIGWLIGRSSTPADAEALLRNLDAQGTQSSSAPATPPSTEVQTPTSTASTEASSSSSAPSSSAAAVPVETTAVSTPDNDCISGTPHNFILTNTRTTPASNPGAVRADIGGLRNLGAMFTGLVYAGAKVDDPQLINEWMDIVTCNGFASQIQMDQFMNSMTDAQIQAFIKAIDGHTDTQGYVIGINSVSGNLSGEALVAEVQRRVALIHSVSGRQVSCWGDLVTSTNADAGIAYGKQFGCDLYVPVFLPFPPPDGYGKVSDYAQAGDVAEGINGASAMVGLQGFGLPGPDEKELGRPTSGDVASFAKLAAVPNYLVYQEGTAANDLNYTAALSKAVAGEIKGN